MFPVIVNPIPEEPLHWYPHDLATLKEFKKAVKEDGPRGPFAEQVFETLSLNLRLERLGKILP